MAICSGCLGFRGSGFRGLGKPHGSLFRLFRGLGVQGLGFREASWQSV